MFQKIATVIGISLCVMSLNSFAQTQELYLEESAANTVSILPKETKIISNAFTCTMKLDCDTSCENDVVNTIHFRVLNKGGTLNGQEINKDDTMDVAIHTGDKLIITAKPAARVELTNIGSTKISSLCNITCR